MNREEVQLLGFEIVAFAGDARSKFLEALTAAQAGDFAKADALIEGGVDFIIIETIIDVQEMRAALLASLDAREAAGKTKKDVQIICQFSFSEDGRTITGTPPAVATTIVEAMGADIIGINCSLGPEQITPLIEEIASVTNLPISCQPNASIN